MRQSIVAILVGFGVAGAGAHPAGAQDEARTITTTGETSSPCVGDPRTPLCALDTWEACFLWTEPSLCEKVGLRGWDYREDESDPFEWEHTFRVITTRAIETRHLASIEAGQFAALQPGQSWFRPGDVEIRWTEEVCLRYRANPRCFTSTARQR